MRSEEVSTANKEFQCLKVQWAEVRAVVREVKQRKRVRRGKSVKSSRKASAPEIEFGIGRDHQPAVPATPVCEANLVAPPTLPAHSSSTISDIHRANMAMRQRIQTSEKTPFDQDETTANPASNISPAVPSSVSESVPLGIPSNAFQFRDIQTTRLHIRHGHSTDRKLLCLGQHALWR